MTNVQMLISKLDAAQAHRCRIGAELSPDSGKLLVQWYEDALEAENTIRFELGAALEQERQEQLYAAYAVALPKAA